jgi:hypothetical protein
MVSDPQHCLFFCLTFNWHTIGTLFMQYTEEKLMDSELKIVAGMARGLVRLEAFHVITNSVADPGCLSRIPDPSFFQPGLLIRRNFFV